MAKRARKKRTNRKLPRLFGVLITCIKALVAWLAGHLWAWARRNPIAATGFFLFALAFASVAYNAVFSQNQIQRQFLFATRPAVADASGVAQSGLDSRNHTMADMLLTNASDQQPRTAGSDQNDMAGFLKPEDRTILTSLKVIQEKLRNLGFYHGDIDGLDGPLTRQAIAAWNNSLSKSVGNYNTPRGEVDLATLIKQGDKIDTITTKTLSSGRPQDTIVHRATPTDPVLPPHQHDRSTAGPAQSFVVRAADISRVQMALRAFGNHNIVVSGKVDKATTDAVLSFQKMFLLKPSGIIDQALMNKMQEIGLIG